MESRRGAHGRQGLERGRIGVERPRHSRDTQDNCTPGRRCSPPPGRQGGIMKSPESMGMNRSGIDQSPEGAQEMTRAVQEFPPSSEGSERTLLQIRAPYVDNADPIGSVPLPGTLKGAAKSGMQKLMGRHAEVLID